MSIKRKKRDWSSLVDIFASLAKGYAASDLRLRDAIKLFCLRLQAENISHASKNTSGKVWGAAPLLLSFCEVFDPILMAIFPVDSYAYKYLLKSKITLPLADRLQNKDSGMEVAEKIEQAIIVHILAYREHSLWSNVNTHYGRT